MDTKNDRLAKALQADILPRLGHNIVADPMHTYTATTYAKRERPYYPYAWCVATADIGFEINCQEYVVSRVAIWLRRQDNKAIQINSPHKEQFSIAEKEDLRPGAHFVQLLHCDTVKDRGSRHGTWSRNTKRQGFRWKNGISVSKYIKN